MYDFAGLSLVDSVRFPYVSVCIVSYKSELRGLRARKRALLNRALVNSRKLTARSSHLHTIEISSPYMAGPLILPAAFEMFIYLRFNVPILSFPYARFTVSLELERIVERNQSRSRVLFLRASSSPHRFPLFSFRSTFKANRNSVKVIQSKVIVRSPLDLITRA